MLELLSAGEKKRLYYLFAALVSMAFIEMAGIASIMPFMAVVSRPDVVQTNKWLKWAYDNLGFTTTHDFLFFLGVLLLVLMVLSNLFKALTSWLTLRYDNQLNYSLARRLLAQYLARPYSFFLNRNTSDMGKNVLAEVRNVIGGVLSAGMQVLSNSLVSLFIFSLLLAVNPLIAVSIAVFLGGAYTGVYMLSRRWLAKISEEQVAANFMKYKTADEALSGIKDLKILGREWMFLEKFAAHAQRHSQNNVTAGTISQLPRYALEVMAFGGILMIVLYFMGADHGSGKMVPLLALYAFAGYRLLPALQLIFSGVTNVRFSMASLKVLHQDLIVDWNDGDPELILNKSKGLQQLSFCRAIELRNVSFCYHGVQEPVIKEINLTIGHNTSIGLVGATGSGKTTTVDLILGLLSPSSGQMLADDIEINGGTLAHWQCNLGYVPQQIYLCDDTITRNIAFGVPDEEIEMAAVIRAASIANLHDFITEKLPKGYNTHIGERGVRLSGGQRQRIGIARALYRDPAVLIMDEATSALDGITEEAVMEALTALSGKKTVIMIAHRLTTVKDCDIIYIMENGRIAGQGTYDELMEASTWFREAARSGE
jgi:ABC-type multidrug transport system fused ATPase/permease subunit